MGQKRSIVRNAKFSERDGGKLSGIAFTGCSEINQPSRNHLDQLIIFVAGEIKRATDDLECCTYGFPLFAVDGGSCWHRHLRWPLLRALWCRGYCRLGYVFSLTVGSCEAMSASSPSAGGAGWQTVPGCPGRAGDRVRRAIRKQSSRRRDRQPCSSAHLRSKCVRKNWRPEAAGRTPCPSAHSLWRPHEPNHPRAEAASRRREAGARTAQGADPGGLRLPERR